MLGGGDAEVGRLDPQGGVVATHRGRAALGLAEGGADDAVVGHRRVEPVLDEQVLADPVDLDLQAALRRVGTGSASDPPCAHPELLDRPQRGAGGAADVVGRVFSPSSSSTTVSGITTSASLERRDARADRR